MASLVVEDYSVGDECLVCFEDFDEELTIEYQDKPDANWKKSPYCYYCVKHIQDTKWGDYVKSVEQADCKASLRRAMADGPPINIRDKVFESETDNPSGEIHMLRYKGESLSAKLKGSLNGEERDKWWSEWKDILQTMEVEDEKEKQSESSTESSTNSTTDTSSDDN